MSPKAKESRGKDAKNREQGVVPPQPPQARPKVFWSFLAIYLGWLAALAYIAWINISAGNQ